MSEVSHFIMLFIHHGGGEQQLLKFSRRAQWISSVFLFKADEKLRMRHGADNVHFIKTSAMQIPFRLNILILPPANAAL